MVMLPSNDPCWPVFLCQPGGGSNSAVWDAFAACRPGVTLNVAPLLSLNTNQCSKLKLRVHHSKKVMAVHWDIYRNAPDLTAIENSILLAAKSILIVLFSSSQLITGNPPCLQFIKVLCQNNLLNAVCIDKAHLFVQCGM
jgi:superfamily II DNA helicase RecQ